MTDVLYPILSKETAGEDFRLHKINEILRDLQSQINHYEHVKNKYSRGKSIIQTISIGSSILSAFFTSGGIATSLTGPAIVIGIPLASVGGILSMLSSGCIIFSKRLTKKEMKHLKIVQLAKTKENTLCSTISKALSDNQISSQEFDLVIQEHEKYYILKSNIQTKLNNNILKKDSGIDMKKIREDMIGSIRADVRKELMDQLTNPKN